MHATKNDVIRFYKMVKDKVIRDKLISNYDEKFNEYITISDIASLHRQVNECIVEGFSWAASPEGHYYWERIANEMYRGKIELNRFTYDL